MKILRLIVPGLLSLSAHAQQSISLDEAVRTALQKNQLIQSAELQVEYFRQIKKTAIDPGKTSAIWTHGQYNSVYQDNNFTFVQTLPFPTLWATQAYLGKEQIVGAQKNLRSAQNELVFAVKSVYYKMVYLAALNKLLESQDSLYADFVNASSLRYKTGESNLLEKTTTETQWMEVKNQLRINMADLQIAGSQLQALMKNETPVLAGDLLKKRGLPELDSAQLAANPQLAYLQQEVIISHRSRNVERMRVLPDISVGYFNQTLVGVQNVNGQDQFFGSSRRFQGFELGLSIPLWVGPQLARARAAGLHEEAQRKTAEHFQTNLQASYIQGLQEIQKNLASLEYYEGSALKNAGLILTQGRTAFTSGQIGYIEYLQLLRSAIAIKSNYLLSLNLYNQSVIKIESLTGKF